MSSSSTLRPSFVPPTRTPSLSPPSLHRVCAARPTRLVRARAASASAHAGVPDGSASSSSSDGGTDRMAEFELSSASPRVCTPDWLTWTLSCSEERTIPLLPFRPSEVFLPGESKTLHFFEARYLALFESCLSQHQPRCAHVLIDSSRGAMAAHGVLLQFRDWKVLGVGVSVTVDAIGRIRATRFIASSPFLKADFHAVRDVMPGKSELRKIRELEGRLWKAVDDVRMKGNRLGMSLLREKIDEASMTIAAAEGYASDDDKMRMNMNEEKEGKKVDVMKVVREAAIRANGNMELDFGENVSDEEMVRRAEALSFAGWEVMPSEAAERQEAVESRSVVARLTQVVERLEQRAATLAAQLALREALGEADRDKF